MKKNKLYLDVCTLCRLYDDQSQLRVRLETEAVLMILDKIKNGYYEMIYSSVHSVEIEAINEHEEQSNLLILLNDFGVKTKTNPKELKEFAQNLINDFKIGIADSAHLAVAEFNSDYFISCDDKLLRKAEKLKLKVKCVNPIQFLVMENLK